MLRPTSELTRRRPSPDQGTDTHLHSEVYLGRVAWSLRDKGHKNNPQLRMSLCVSRTSSETWKTLEEDLNQRFLALRSPPVRSHCATSLTSQSHVGLTQGSASSVEETNNPISFLLLLLFLPPHPQHSPHPLWIP